MSLCIAALLAGTVGILPAKAADAALKVTTPGNKVQTYQYQKAQDFTDKSDKDTYGGQISYIPWHSGSAILNAGYKSWELNYSFIYTGERYDVSANTPENYRLPWYTSDFSLAKKFGWRKYDFKLTLEVNNIFNQQYEVVRSYPMPGTNFKFILNLTI